MLLWRCAGFKIFDITETHRKPVKAGEDSHGEGSGVLFQLDFLCKYNLRMLVVFDQAPVHRPDGLTQWFLVG